MESESELEENADELLNNLLAVYQHADNSMEDFDKLLTIRYFEGKIRTQTADELGVEADDLDEVLGAVLDEPAGLDSERFQKARDELIENADT